MKRTVFSTEIISEEDKRRYEDDFAEDGTMPEEIPSHALNKFIFNEKTVDTVLQDLMERGIKVAGGDRIGKNDHFRSEQNSCAVYRGTL